MTPDVISIDFETYSEAGYLFDPDTQRWRGLTKNARGLSAVGAAVYSEHASTRVLCMAYDMHDGSAPRIWTPDAPPPFDVFERLQNGAVIVAWNSFFEHCIWQNVCHKRMGWPELPIAQTVDTMAAARAWGLPGKLEKAAKALSIQNQKIADGKRLIKKFSIPQQPKKATKNGRLFDDLEADDMARMYAYCIGDVRAENELAGRIPALTDSEARIWRLDQVINARGVHVDAAGIDACMSIVGQAEKRYTQRVNELTGGAVSSVSEVKKTLDWIHTRGVTLDALDADTVAGALKAGEAPPDVLEVLRVRAMLASNSVKKLYAMERRICSDGRIRGMFAYAGAERTARWAGRGPQPQNMPAGGPAIHECTTCNRSIGARVGFCPWCGSESTQAVDWGDGGAQDALAVIRTRSLDSVEHFYGDAVSAVSGCLRGLFVAAPGKEFIASDYSAIEAVVLAAIAGERWRLGVFRTHGRIYEMSAANITGVSFAEMMEYKERTGENHPLRKKVGKVAELASGYQGSVGAWKKFGADKYFADDDRILSAVKAWRRDSPNIVNLWYGLERAAKAAVKSPGACFEYSGISYTVLENVLYCTLPSGRYLAYHEPLLIPGVNQWGREGEKLTFMGYNSDYTKGPIDWIRMETYGGKLTENAVQATARDILAHAMINIEAAGYPIVLHVHDEIVAEVPAGYGSIKEFEAIMATLPAWAADWPLRAAGGWRGKRYRKG